MELLIREVGVEREKSSLLDFLSRHLPTRADESQFDWAYLANPHGKARAWLLEEVGRADVLGIAAAFPRRAWVERREDTVWLLGDFCVDGRARSLGPALKLQKTCLAGVPFCYDFPSTAMMAIYQRLGIESREKLVRFAKPLRVDRKVDEVLDVPLLSSGVKGAGNRVLNWLERGPKVADGVAFSLHAGPCGEEFTSLARDAAAERGVAVQRSAGYLNWRYFNHPYLRFELVTARQNENLVGYAVFHVSGDDVVLVDLMGSNGALPGLVHEVVRLARERQAVTVNASLLEGHAWSVWLRDLGFHARETAPVVVHADSGGSDSRWFLMEGDRDT